MKTLFTFALAFSICFSILASPKSDTLGTLTGVSYSYQKVKVTLLDGAGRVKVSIYDDWGNKIHGALIEVSDNIVYPIDMSQMPSGKYTVRISNKSGKVDQSIEVKPRTR